MFVNFNFKDHTLKNTGLNFLWGVLYLTLMYTKHQFSFEWTEQKCVLDWIEMTPCPKVKKRDFQTKDGNIF